MDYELKNLHKYAKKHRASSYVTRLQMYNNMKNRLEALGLESSVYAQEIKKLTKEMNI